jgi:hypothetical protein
MIGLFIELAVMAIVLAIRLTILLIVWTVRLSAMLIAAILAFAQSRQSGRPSGVAPGLRQPLDTDLRWRVFQRDGYACSACGSETDLTVDHIHPVALGGNNDPSNLRTLCRSCNSRKGASLVAV